MWTYLCLSVVLATVAITTAEDGDVELSLLKRLMTAIKKKSEDRAFTEERNEEKRSMQTVVRDPQNHQIKVYFIACVKGDRGTTQCDKKVRTHYWQVLVLDNKGRVIEGKWGETRKYMDIDPEKGGRGPVETIDLDFVKGRTYRVLACEVTEDEEFKTCNKVEFDHTGQGSFFPTYVKNPAIIKGSNRLPAK